MQSLFLPLIVTAVSGTAVYALYAKNKENEERLTNTMSQLSAANATFGTQQSALAAALEKLKAQTEANAVLVDELQEADEKISSFERQQTATVNANTTPPNSNPAPAPRPPPPAPRPTPPQQPSVAANPSFTPAFKASIDWFNGHVAAYITPLQPLKSTLENLYILSRDVNDFINKAVGAQPSLTAKQQNDLRAFYIEAKKMGMR